MFELDLYWIIYGNENPLAYLSEHADRFFAYHVKDRVWKDRPDADDFEDAGPGRIDFPRHLRRGRRRAGQALLHRARPAAALAPRPRDAEAQLTTAKVGIEFLQEVTWK